MYVLFVVSFLIINALFPETFFGVLSFLRLIFCQRSLQLVINTGTCIQCTFSIGKGGVTSGRGKCGVLCTSFIMRAVATVSEKRSAQVGT